MIKGGGRRRRGGGRERMGVRVGGFEVERGETAVDTTSQYRVVEEGS